MGAMITIDFEGDDELRAALPEVSRALSDASPLYQSLAELRLVQAHEGFQTQTAPDGTPWAAKTAATIERYMHGGWSNPDRRPLFGESKALRTTLNADDGPDCASVGSPMEYAATMPYGALQRAFRTTSRGGPIPWGNIPARPFIGLSSKNEADLTDAVCEYLADAFAKVR